MIDAIGKRDARALLSTVFMAAHISASRDSRLDDTDDMADLSVRRADALMKRLERST